MSYEIKQYNGSEFAGKSVFADVDFFPALDRINQYAKDSGVTIFVTSSYRDYVIEVKKDNHEIGHAIDMNLIINATGHLCNSECLPNDPDAKVFFDLIRNDGELRTGLDFHQPDPVHIDDGYNQNIIAWTIKHDGGNTGVSSTDEIAGNTNSSEGPDVSDLTRKNKKDFFLVQVF